MIGLSMCARYARTVARPNLTRLLSNRSKRCFSTVEETKEKPASAADNEQKQETKEDDGLSKEIEQLNSQVKELQDKYMRALAETENTRVRMTKQVDDARQFGLQGFCKDLLTVADVLSAATQSVPKEELTNANKPLVSLYEGLSQTHSLLTDAFSKHGLIVIDPLSGDKFDPHVHEAQFQAPPQDGAAPGSVSACLQVGWKLHDRTLRPARVGVVKE